MTPDLLERIAIRPALSLLPEKMTDERAVKMLLAIAGQESAFEARRQHGFGPSSMKGAAGFWQLELSGAVTLVLNHAQTGPHLREVLSALRYPAAPDILFVAVQHNDILCAAYSRLNLWWYPPPLTDNEELAWGQYIETWRPGAYWNAGQSKRLELRRRWSYWWRVAHGQ